MWTGTTRGPTCSSCWSTIGRGPPSSSRRTRRAGRRPRRDRHGETATRDGSAFCALVAPVAGPRRAFCRAGYNDALTLPAGRRLGPYEVRQPLGAGGMGEVYLAEDTRLQRRVAVKVLPLAFAANAERVQRFEQEARATAT